MRTTSALLAILAASLSVPALAIEPAKGTSNDAATATPTSVEIVGHVYLPVQVPVTPERVAMLKAPAGFKVEIWAQELGDPRMIVADDNGNVYVSRRKTKDLILLHDKDGDGKAEAPQVLASREPMIHGLSLKDGKLYATTIREVLCADVNEDGTIGELTGIVTGLPDAGQHPNRTIGFSPNGKLFISVGSTANAADENNKESATMLVADPADGFTRRIFATGLRNTIGFAWHPKTGQLWGADHGIDWLGDDDQPEEFNRLTDGGKYGWPFIYADGKFNPADKPQESSYQKLAAESVEPSLLYIAHSAPMQMAFYDAESFPPEYRGDAFIAMHGSWNRIPPSGHEVVRVSFDDSGTPEKIEPFLTGFLQERDDGEYERFGRPCGLAVLRDGSMLVSDDMNGVIYRITYGG